MVWALSKLENDEINKIKSLEKKLGVELLGFTDIDVEIAGLNEEELQKIRDLEEDLDISLIAISEK